MPRKRGIGRLELGRSMQNALDGPRCTVKPVFHYVRRTAVERGYAFSPIEVAAPSNSYTRATHEGNDEVHSAVYIRNGYLRLEVRIDAVPGVAALIEAVREERFKYDRDGVAEWARIRASNNEQVDDWFRLLDFVDNATPGWRR